MSIRVFAPAKINLTLAVGPAGEDGMHPLQSVVAFADIGDWIEAEASGALSLRIAGPFQNELCEGDPENLALRAARALARAGGVAPKAALSLEKNLPVAAGIGGGSADAAAALHALNRLWGLGFDLMRLAEIGGTLGADVPVCVAGHLAYMTAAGAAFAPMRGPSFDAVLVNPRRALATALVYRAFDQMRLGANFAPAPAPSWATRAEALSSMIATGNSLDLPAASLLGEVATVLETLRIDSRVQYAALSGSGATCFALVADRAQAQTLAADLGDGHPHWWIAPARLAGA
jgi:4-diphosphocytidyl-2-C-methyl-D-erythritol kinase